SAASVTSDASGESVATSPESRASGASQADEADEVATVVNPSPTRSFDSTGARRPLPLALIIGSLALAALLGLLLYAWRSRPANNGAATVTNTNATPSPVATPSAQATATATPNASPAATPNASPQPTVAPHATVAEEKERVALRSAIDSWLAAHSTRNLTQVTNFYMPNVSAFYLTQNTTRAAVRAEKARLFREPNMSIRRTGDPQITFGQDGSTATTTFRKSYSRGDASRPQSGEVLQEIVWQKTNRGWKIISERDLRVIR
ncbi:MAG: SnoaL-like domain, partial [Pyrinomonadaceae bacterium]|nr:SnoaL-like domain [Pyrinomonadaceae bacterium]